MLGFLCIAAPQRVARTSLTLWHKRGPGVRSAWAGRIIEAAAVAVSLRQACPALAAVTVQGAGLRLDFLSLAAELNFSVLLHIGVCPINIYLLDPAPLVRFHEHATQSTAQKNPGTLLARPFLQAPASRWMQ